MRVVGPIDDFAQEQVAKCYASRQERISEYRFWRSMFFSGSADETPAIYNKCGPHVKRKKSWLISPSDIRFSLEFDYTDGQPWLTRALRASSYLSREYHRTGTDIQFGDGVEWALIKGCTLVKHLWGRDGVEPWLVQPEFFGVLDETEKDLDRQDAFVHTCYLLPAQLERMLKNHPERADIMRKVRAGIAQRREDDPRQDDYFHQIVIGGTQPVTTGPNSGSGMVSVVNGPTPKLDPKVIAELIEFHELWFIDDEREDYTTVQYIEAGGPIVVEGEIKRRNLMGDATMLKMHHPFVKNCPNDLDGYFWGRSELASVQLLQDMISRRIRDIRSIWRRQARPPKAYIGFSGMNDEKHRAANAPDGQISEQNPNAKIESLAPQLPQGALQELELAMQWFDDEAGFGANVLQGVGDTGMRSQLQAQTMTRNASPRLRDSALVVERQIGKSGDLFFKLLQAKDAKVFVSESKEKFFLSQMPDDYRVTVDSHSASPAFTIDEMQQAAFMLGRQVIDPVSYLELTHPPMEDTLIARAKAREQQTAELLKAHPELLAKEFGRKR